jgi:hypothetical protein
VGAPPWMPDVIEGTSRFSRSGASDHGANSGNGIPSQRSS